jgi:hypothetical protein
VVINSETMIVPPSTYNRRKDEVVKLGLKSTPVALAMAVCEAMELAGQCYDAQKFYANECERLREEIRQLHQLTTRPQGEK